MSKYNRYFVQDCIDAGIAHKKKGEFREAAVKAQEGLNNLKLYTEFPAINLKKAKGHEERGDILIKQDRFQDAYKEYSMAITNLHIYQTYTSGAVDAVGCLLACLGGFYMPPGGRLLPPSSSSTDTPEMK